MRLSLKVSNRRRNCDGRTICLGRNVTVATPDVNEHNLGNYVANQAELAGASQIRQIPVFRRCRNTEAVKSISGDAIYKTAGTNNISWVVCKVSVRSSPPTQILGELQLY